MKLPRFGVLLREFRVAAGLSQEALAERAAMSANGISALERGANQAPQLQTLSLLVGALELNPEQRQRLEAAAVRPPQRRGITNRALANHNLPHTSTPFFGRKRDIEAVVRLLENASLVTLTGAGGIGKTRLALEIAHGLLAGFHDGVRFVDLAPLRDPELVPSAIGARFGIKESDGESTVETLVHSLARKSVLLIVDNCEHLAAAVAPVVQALIGGCPQMRVLATSRQSLNVPSEQIYRVESLGAEAATALFEERAKLSGASLALSDENRDAIERIVRRLDGIALAIELAAARTNVLTLQQLEERLTERFHLLTGGSSVVLPRQQTMRTALDWSYDLLDVRERRLLRRLWVFPSTFTLDAALAVCRDADEDEWRIIEVLASLVDKSLLISAPLGVVQRYRLLETMRAYAFERLEETDEIAALQARHAAFYAELAERAERVLDSATSTIGWTQAFEPELENFRAAVEWSLGLGGDITAGAQLLTRLQEFWITQGFAMEVARRAQECLEADRSLPESLQAELWLTVARMRQEVFTHPQVMLDAARSARALYEACDDRSGLALALRQQGAAEMRLGAYEESQKHFEESIRLYRELGDQRMVARALGYLASLLQVRKAYAQARTILTEVLQMSRDIGDDRIVPTVAINLAETEFALGEHENAVGRARENLAHEEMLRKSSEMRATQEANLSAYLFALGRIDEARAMALSSVRDGNGAFAAVPLQHLAAITAQSDPQRAATLLGYVDTAFEAAAFTRQFTEQFTYDRLAETLKSRMKEDDIARFARDGATMSERQIRRLAQRDLPSGKSEPGVQT